MKSLRNTWKKWEQKVSNNTDTSTANLKAPVKSGPSSSSTGPRLTITVNHLPLTDATVTSIPGTWQDAKLYKPPSPIYDQFTQHRSPRPRDTPSSVLDASHRGPARRDSLKPPERRGYISSTSVGKLSATPSSTNVFWPHSSSTDWLHPQSPTLPSYQLLPPIDLTDGSGTRLDCSSTQKRLDSPTRSHEKQPSGCRESFVLSDAQDRRKSIKSSHIPRSSPDTVHAILDLSSDKRRSLYHRSSSTPYLPYQDNISHPSRSNASLSPTDESETDDFPLSLFPQPPPLTAHGSIPAPLTLRAASSQSSRDSTPVGTPTTPRFNSMSSPSQTSVYLPKKKRSFGRSTGHCPPPLWSPPNTPLPDPPVSRHKPGDTSEQLHRHSLRMAHSTSNLRMDVLPFPATHRLTVSDTTSDHLRRPIRRSTKLRPETTVMKELPPSPSGETHVQWGYAL